MQKKEKLLSVSEKTLEPWRFLAEGMHVIWCWVHWTPCRCLRTVPGHSSTMICRLWRCRCCCSARWRGKLLKNEVQDCLNDWEASKDGSEHPNKLNYAISHRFFQHSNSFLVCSVGHWQNPEWENLSLGHFLRRVLSVFPCSLESSKRVSLSFPNSFCFFSSFSFFRWHFSARLT